jgi:hypothetical protein
MGSLNLTPLSAHGLPVMLRVVAASRKQFKVDEKPSSEFMDSATTLRYAQNDKWRRKLL